MEFVLLEMEGEVTEIAERVVLSWKMSRRISAAARSLISGVIGPDEYEFLGVDEPDPVTVTHSEGSSSTDSQS